MCFRKGSLGCSSACPLASAFESAIKPQSSVRNHSHIAKKKYTICSRFLCVLYRIGFSRCLFVEDLTHYADQNIARDENTREQPLKNTRRFR